jgi:aryl-alcohol dehydrogenase-like predicted oxidoreductase
MPDATLNRRAFLRLIAATTASAALAACAPTTATVAPATATGTVSPTKAATATLTNTATVTATATRVSTKPVPATSLIPRRTLGQTGRLLSVVGFGGIVVMNETADSASELVAQAIARGINYFDVAPSYGNAEERLGPALEPYRQSVFLACKTGQRTKSGAESELKRSLERLRTDHFDLYQLHAVTTLAEVEQIMAADGALKAFLEAREKGLIRHIGFSAHTQEAALALMERFAFDTILFPINWVCWQQGNFGPKALEKAQEKGLGILALKALGKRQWASGETKKWPKCWYAPVDSAEEAALALRFTLGKPITAAVSPSHAELLWWACDAAEKLTPLTAEEEAKLAELGKGLDPVFRA